MAMAMAKEKIGGKTNEIGDKIEIVAEAIKAYGIDQEYVFASKSYPETGEAVILTHGGSEVRYKRGDTPVPLSETAITGINPEMAKRKVIAGKAKK